MIPLSEQASQSLQAKDEKQEASLKDPQIFLRVNNGDERSFPCRLHAITKGQFHLTSKYYFNEGLYVILSFGYVEIPGVVLYSARQENSTSLCVGAMSMESRAEPRFPINQPARLIALHDKTAAPMPCLLADISRSGMGVRLSQPIEEGETAYVETDAALVIAEVRHCVQSRSGVFRAGLRIVDIVAGRRPKTSRLRALTEFVSRLAAKCFHDETSAPDA
jgi:hypothetical protein